MKRHALIISFLLFVTAVLAGAEEKRFAVPVGDSPQKGSPKAPVTIIEFIDFQ